MTESVVVRHVREIMSSMFPMLTQEGHGLNAHGVGGLSQRGRYHPTGRAADIFFNANDDLEGRIGDLVFQMFHRYHRQLGTEHVIWRRQIWSLERRSVRRYTGTSPHTNHIHVFFTEAAADQRPRLLREKCIEIAVEVGIAVRA